MHKAHVYRNTLIRIERERRAATRAAMSAYEDVFALEKAAEEAIKVEEDAAKALKSERAKNRALKVSSELRAALQQARNIKREAVRALRERRTQLKNDPKIQEATAVIDENAAARIREERGKCGVYWGTYLLVEDAMQASRSTPLYDDAEPNDPKFVRWTGNCAVGMQIQKGMTTSAVFAENTRLQIDPVNEKAWYSEIRSERRKLSRTILRLRVGSEGRDPIWAAWPMIMHRPLPENGIVKRATVHVRRRGPLEEWSVDITVTEPEIPFSRCGKGIVGIDLGWRLLGDKLRVATCSGEDGACGELHLPADCISALRKVGDLQEIRDSNFNKARNELAAWLKDRDVPEWLKKATERLSMWRSKSRLAALVRRWKNNRFDGDASVFNKLEKWCYHDRHLWAWESNQRIKALRRRREVYRCFAADLASKYECVALDDLYLQEIAKKQDIAKEKSENKVSRSNRQLVATSTLRLALTQAFAGCGGRVLILPRNQRTMRCHVCGRIEVFDNAVNLRHTCQNGHEWDQDYNAAANILRDAREQPSDEQKPGDACDDEKASANKVVGESKRQRARRLKSEKQQLDTTARKCGV